MGFNVAMQGIFAAQPHLWQWVSELPDSAGVRLFTEWAQELQTAVEQMQVLSPPQAREVLSLLEHLDKQHVGFANLAPVPVSALCI